MENNRLIQTIKAKQEQESLTLTEMARKLGVSQATLSRVYNSQRGIGHKFLGGVLVAYPDLQDEVALFLSRSIP